MLTFPQKAAHYQAQLNAALVAGKWTADKPAKDFKGSPISWNDLVRKARKHCDSDGIELADVAEQNRALVMLLVKSLGKAGNNLDGDKISTEAPLALGEQHTLLEEDLAQARKILDKLSSEKVSQRCALSRAYFHYTMRDTVGSLAEITQCDLEVFEDEKILGPRRKDPDGSSILGFGSPRPASARSVHAEIRNGSTWATTELIRGFCVQGLCLETQSPPNPKNALSIYSKAISRIMTVQFPNNKVAPLPFVPSATAHMHVWNTSHPAGPGPPPPSNEVFVQYRELHRWIQFVLFRGVVLSASARNYAGVSGTAPGEQTGGMGMTTLDLARIHRQQSIKGRWPASFRSKHRIMVLNIHLRALIHQAQSSSSSSSTTSTTGSGSGSTLSTLNAQLMSEAKALAGEYKILLEYSTCFPRAGERNELVEEYVDLLVALWGVGGDFRGEEGSWVVDILWWATTLTFNSPRIYRHLTYLLASQATAHSHLLARRTLRVYVEVVGKARASGDRTNPERGEVWVRTLVDGVRILCRRALESGSWNKDGNGSGDGDGDGEEDLRDAMRYLDVARADLGGIGIGDGDEERKELEAAIELAQGIVSSVLAIKEENPTTRLPRLSTSLTHHLRSLTLHPTPTAHYHLALAFYRSTPSQDIPRAISHAKKAIEGRPGEARAWHLLGLLLMASGEWAKAMRVVEEGVGVAERAFARSRGIGGGGATATVTHVQNTQGKEFASFSEAGQTLSQIPPENQGSKQNESILGDQSSSDINTLPPAYLLIPKIPDPPPASRREEFTIALQLRLTLLALVEHAQGSEKASACWLELFSWFRERRGWVVDGFSGDASPHGLDTQEAQAQTVPTSNAKDEPGQESMPNRLHKRHSFKPSTDTRDELIPPTTIKVTPPTPLDDSTGGGGGGPLGGPDDDERRSLSADSMSVGSEIDENQNRQNRLKQRREVNGSDELGRPLPRRQGSKDSGHKSKKVQALLKTQVYKGAEGFKTVSRRISKAGVNVGKRHDGITLHRSSSAPDFHAVLAATRPYQASSIHSRSRLSSWNIHRSTAHEQVRTRATSSAGTAARTVSVLHSTPPGEANSTSASSELDPWEKKMLCDLWIRAAATFRRGDDIDECRSAIQEAEELDENNVGVWVQYGLYLVANSDIAQAHEAFNKALFADPEDVSASIHLSNLLLSPPDSKGGSEHSSKTTVPSADDIQMAVGLLTNTTLYRGWDSAEAWYLLAKGRRLQGSKARERDCLTHALELSRVRGVRVVREALGECI